MNRRDALKAFAGLALCPLSRPVHAAEGAHWSYEGATGPAKWGDLDAASKVCAIGQQQSPIDIITPLKAQLPPLRLNWAKSADTIVNNGHTIQLNFADGSSLTLGDRNSSCCRCTSTVRASTWSRARVFRWKRISCTARIPVHSPWAAC